jgi:hypothetical protein
MRKMVMALSVLFAIGMVGMPQNARGAKAEDAQLAVEQFRRMRMVCEKTHSATKSLIDKDIANGNFQSAMNRADKIKDEGCWLVMVEGISTEAYRLMLKQLRAKNFKSAEQTLVKYILYPERRDGAICQLVIEYIRAGDFGRAESWVMFLNADGQMQFALYNLAVDGYAARGKIGWALSTVKRLGLFAANGVHRTVPKERHILRDMAITVAMNPHHLDEVEVRLDIIKIFSLIGDDTYYEVMALLPVLLNMPTEQSAEALMRGLGYHRIDKAESEHIDTIGDLVIIHYSKNGSHATFIVKYGMEAGAGSKPFMVDRQLDDVGREKFSFGVAEDDMFRDFIRKQLADHGIKSAQDLNEEGVEFARSLLLMNDFVLAGRSDFNLRGYLEGILNDESDHHW